jgi:hypothetical protein
MSLLNKCPCCIDALPDGYYEEPIDSIPSKDLDWDDARHTAITNPATVALLDNELKTDPNIVKQLATNYGCCSSFRILSDEGIKVMDQVLQKVEKHATSTARIPKLLRGATFRSKFLNGMAHSPAVLQHVSRLAGCEMVYHPMKIHHLHVNFKPDDNVEVVDGKTVVTKRNVDRWHCDSTPFVLIVFCTDPAEYTGGELQYFHGTREEGMRILGSGASLPADRIRNVGTQHKGYGVFMQVKYISLIELKLKVIR